MEILILAVLFNGALTATIAAAKGRRVLPWFLLGSIGGIFAMLYVAFASRRQVSA